MKDVVGVHYAIFTIVGLTKKQKAFDWCWEQYANDNQSTAFGVGNANTFGFTCSWLAIKEGENIMRIETKGNSYLVWLDR